MILSESDLKVHALSVVSEQSIHTTIVYHTILT